MTGHSLTVRRLRWREPGPNRLAARHRLELALEAGSNASALRPDAILCVRRIATSFPDLDRLSDVLDAEIRNAACPARGSVPANANAVLFADRAELLACLARDWCAATLGRDWWWPVLFPSNDFSNLVRRWLADAAAIPAAMNRLALAGWATAFLRKLGPVDLNSLWRSLVRTFGLAKLEQAWELGHLTNNNPMASDSIPLTDSIGIGSGLIAVTTGSTPPAAPWIPWFRPEPSLPASATRFLVTAVLLERAAAKVRSASFAEAVAAWVKSPVQNAPELDFTIENLPAEKDSLPPAGPENDPASNEPGIVLERAAGCEAKPRGRLDGAKDQGNARSSKPELPVAIVGARRHQRPAQRNGAAEQQPELTDRWTNKLSVASSDPAEPDPLPAAPMPDRIVSEWSGLLYLTNLAIVVGLYPDFTAPVQPGLALSLWDFLALLGERMIGKEFKDDPLAGLLARLSGRAMEDRPGGEFEPPTGEPLDLWVERVSRDFDESVGRSLVLDPQRDFRLVVLKHRARIEAGSTCLEAHFSLAEHPIELRLAGLDRDPGWVPAAGRAIRFHYD